MGESTVAGSAGAPARSHLYDPIGMPLLLLLSVGLPTLVALQPGPGNWDTAFALQYVLTAYAGARLAMTVLSHDILLLQGVFWLFCYTAIGIAPLAQNVLGATPTPVVGPRAAMTTAVVLALLGCLAFDVGCVLARRRRVWAPGRDVRGTFSAGRVGALAVVAVLASALLVRRLGGVGTFFTSRQAISSGLADSGLADGGSQVGSAFLRGFGTAPALLAFLILTRWLVTSPPARRPLVLAGWFGLLLVNLVVNNPISNPRYWFLTVLLSTIFVTFPRSRRTYRAALLFGAVAALLLFPYADRFRYAEGAQRPLETSSWLEPMALKDYDQMAMLANTVSYVQDGPGHTYGGQFLGSVLFWVPRQVWPGKPIDTGVLLGQWMGTNNTNLSAPLWTEFWLDLGVGGMCLGFVGCGYLAARGDRLYTAQTVLDPRPGSVMAIVIPVIAGYEFILLRGSLLQAMGRVAIMALAILLVRTTRSDARTPQPPPVQDPGQLRR